MGCDGCELFPSSAKLAGVVRRWLEGNDVVVTETLDRAVREQLLSRLPTEIYHARQSIAAAILVSASSDSKHKIPRLARVIADEFRCYAAILHLRYSKNPNKPGSAGKKGFAPVFEEVTKFPGRMAATAKLPDLFGLNHSEKPWLDGSRRLIFLSDMGDLLSKAISFKYIRDEVVAHVASAAGSRHLWLWLTKRPERMAKFCDWLAEEGIPWPDNLVAMTSVTSAATTSRVRALQKVRCRYRGLSVEPLWTPVTLPLEGIDWVIVGGESGGGAREFGLEWARDLHRQCRASATAFFVKQLGARPADGKKSLRLSDRHGGDWDEWPADLKVRQLPPGFKLQPAVAL